MGGVIWLEEGMLEQALVVVSWHNTFRSWSAWFNNTPMDSHNCIWHKGFIAAVITIALPVVAELFWGYQIWSASGIFFNWYIIPSLAYAGLWILMWVLMIVFAPLLDT